MKYDTYIVLHFERGDPTLPLMSLALISARRLAIACNNSYDQSWL